LRAPVASSTTSSKCFTVTVPAGKLHSPAALNATCSDASYGGPSFGTAIHRVLTALSDQDAALTANGIRAGCGVSAPRSVNTPVCESSGSALKSPRASFGLSSPGPTGVRVIAGPQRTATSVTSARATPSPWVTPQASAGGIGWASTATWYGSPSATRAANVNVEAPAGIASSPASWLRRTSPGEVSPITVPPIVCMPPPPPSSSPLAPSMPGVPHATAPVTSSASSAATGCSDGPRRARRVHRSIWWKVRLICCLWSVRGTSRAGRACSSADAGEACACGDTDAELRGWYRVNVE
jgi:hypothetical protein